MKTTLLITALVAGFGGTAALAQDRGMFGGDDGPMTFATLDANADGMLTPEDMVALQAARFAAADTDGDGALSEAEVIAQATADAATMIAERATRMITRIDSNEDGLLQAEEVTEAMSGRGMERMLARFDADEDGALSEAEFDTARAEMADRMGGRGEGRGHGHGNRGDRGGPDRG
jgi:hypothetical protein